MRAVLLIAGKDLRQRLRDRSAIVLGFVAPVAIATLMSFAFQSSEDFHFTLGVVDEDGGPIAASLVEVLRSDQVAGIVTVREVDTAGQAHALVEDGNVATAIVVPKGFSLAATSVGPGEATALRVLASIDEGLAAQVTRAITDGFLAQVNANRLSIATAAAASARAGAVLDDLTPLITAVDRARLPEQVDQRSGAAERLRAISYFAPGMGIFFVLFAVGFAARSFFGEQQQGTLERMAIAPIPRLAILAGKALSVFVYAVASLGSMALVTGIVFSADWGHPVAAAVVIVAVAGAVVGVTALVIAAARSERQAEGMAAVAVFTLALLGGNFIFISAAPPTMRALSLATPNGWALRAFTDLATTRGGLTHDLGLIAGPLTGILVFTTVVAVAAALLSRRVALR